MIGLDSFGTQALPTLIVVRHGATDFNRQSETGDGAEERLRGWLDVPLNARGRAEAQTTAEILPRDLKVSRVVSSDLQRAMDTAQAIGDRFGVEIEANQSLRPWNLGIMHGLPMKKILSWMLYYLDRDRKIPPGSNESFSDFQTRTLTAFKMLMDEARDHVANGAIVAVTHSRNTRTLKGWLNNGAGDVHEIDKTPVLNKEEVVQTGQPMIVQYINGRWRHVATDEVISMPKQVNVVGLDSFGASAAGAGAGAGSIIDPYAPGGSQWQGPMTPEQLSKLDRVPTPAEQKVVDDWQSKQGDAAQAAEEAKPFINPQTGKLSYVKIDTAPGDKAPLDSNWWLIGGALLGGLGGAFLAKNGLIGGFAGVLVGGVAGFGISELQTRTSIVKGTKA